MNERIRELLSQADIKFDKDIDEIDVCVMLPSSLEKFAQLIIDECMSCIRNQSMDSGDEWEDGLRMAESAIQERFGVGS